MTLPLKPRTVTKHFACIGNKVGDWTFKAIDKPDDVCLFMTPEVSVHLGTEVTIYALRHFSRTFYVGGRPVVIHEGEYAGLELKL